MVPSSTYQLRMEVMVSSMARMKHAEHWGFSSTPTLNQTGELKAAFGVPRRPRKYFWATMFVAFWLHDVGNSTPRCSKALPPSLKLGMTASRVSHSISSNGCTPSFVKYGLKRRPFPRTSTSRSLVATAPLLTPAGGSGDLARTEDRPE